MFFDSHCHLYMKDFNDDREAVVARARAAGVVGMVFIGYSLDSSQRAVELAEELDGCYAAVGIHPHDAKSGSTEVWQSLAALARSSSRVVAVGETGLDYYRDLSPRDVQAAGFRAQLALARELDRPVVVHDRDAHEDTMRILADAAEGLTVVLHCFSGNRAMAEEAWTRGYSTGVSGPVTYPAAEPLRALLRDAPRHRILIETDAPYLAPQAHRGRRSEPVHVVHAAEQLAALWGIAPEEVGRLTTANARRFYRLPSG